MGWHSKIGASLWHGSMKDEAGSWRCKERAIFKKIV
jgi:hypothetical protein